MSKSEVCSHLLKIQKEKKGLIESPDGQRLIKYFTYMNSDPAHFVWEMLQNAEDVKATEISFTLHQDSLYVRHNGTPFTPSNVEAICALLLSDKRETEGQIGKFGAGFKTVFAYTDAPEIYSGDYTFRITHLVNPEYISVTNETITPPEETLFILPFRYPELAVKDITKKLRGLSTQSLMFLKHIEKITINLDGIPRVVTRTVKESEQFFENSQFEHITIRDSEIDKEYYRFTLSGITLKDIDEFGEILEMSNQSVMIAYRLGPDGKIVPITKSKDINKYFVFFPTEVETHLEYLAHAPFKTALNRETFIADSPVNETLYQKLIDLVVISLKYLVKRGIADSDFYNQILLPGGAVYPKIFPYDMLTKKLISTLANGEELIPTYEGGYCKYYEILIEAYKSTDKDVIKKNFSAPEIAHVISDYRHRKYWDSGFYGTNLYKLINFTKDEYNAGELEINLKQLLDALTPTWMAQKTLTQLINFYGEFASTSLKPTVNFNVIGREKLRTIPLVRRPDNTHITPQRAYWRSEDIHPDLMHDSIASYFLRELMQIPGYDAISEIKERLESRYTGDMIDVSLETNVEDIQAILNAVSKGKLSPNEIYYLKFIYGVNARTRKPAWCRPGSVYLSSRNGGDSDTEIILDGVTDVYFTHPMYEQFGTKLEVLGLIKEMKIEVGHDQFSCGELVEKQIREYASFKRGPIFLWPQENFKPNVSISNLKDILASSFSPKKSLALYRFLSANLQYIKGTVQWSTSRTNSKSKSIRNGTLEVFSELGYRLKTIPWLYSKNKVGQLPHKLSAQTIMPDYLYDKELLELLGVSGVTSKKLSAWIPEDQDIPMEMRQLIDTTARFTSEELKIVLENLKRPQSVKSVFTSLLEQNNNQESIESDDDDEFVPTPINNLEKRTRKLNEKISDGLTGKIRKEKEENQDPDDWMKNPKVIRLFESAGSKDEKLFFETLGEALGTSLVDYGCIDSNKDERAFLEQEYQGRCQICSTRIPKALKPGSRQFPYHYVARNVIRTRDLDALYRDSQIIDGWNSLCLCPMCAAKYLYCSKDLSAFADQVLNLKINPGARTVYEIKIKLNGKTETIHYMPKHILALQTALKYFKAYEERDAANK